MPTDNPKISAYVPQVVYDRFVEFYKGTGLSMSQSATVIFAQYFGLEDIVKEIRGETTIDDSALDRIKILEDRFDDLLKKISELEGKSSDGLPQLMIVESDNKEIDTSLDENILSKPLDELPYPTTDIPVLDLDSLQGELLSKPPIQVPTISDTLLAKRLLTKKGGPIGTSNFRVKKERSSTEDFFAWTIHTDPDNIGWECDEKTRLCTPDKNLSDELKSKLLKWIQENS
jgi:hypothetical protein